MRKIIFAAGCAAVAAFSGCMTASTRIPEGAAVETVAGFSQDDLEDVVRRAVDSIVLQDRIRLKEGANRAIVIVEDVTNDTMSLGVQAEALAEGLGQALRQELTDRGRVIVYNKAIGQSASVRVEPQYVVYGRLTQRNMRKDNGDFYKEFSLNLRLVEISTGLEFWQKRIPLRKLVDRANVLN